MCPSVQNHERLSTRQPIPATPGHVSVIVGPHLSRVRSSLCQGLSNWQFHLALASIWQQLPGQPRLPSTAEWAAVSLVCLPAFRVEQARLHLHPRVNPLQSLYSDYAVSSDYLPQKRQRPAQPCTAAWLPGLPPTMLRRGANVADFGAGHRCKEPSL